MNKKKYSSLLIWSAALISVVRYAGAFIASDAGSITGWASTALLYLMGFTGIGMGILDSIGTAFLFNGWRMTMPKNGAKWPFKFKILTFFVFGLIVDGLVILIPFTVSRVLSLGMGNILSGGVWGWALAVNIAPYMLLGGVVSGNANMITDDTGKQEESYQKDKVETKENVQKLSGNWRKVRPLLTLQQVAQLANMEVPEIQKSFSAYDLSERTAWNWREYAREEVKV